MMNAMKTMQVMTVAALAGIWAAGCNPPAGGQVKADTAPKADKTAESARAVSDATFDAAIAKGVALVDFWAPWCGPCRMQGPIVERVAEAVGEKAVVAKLNVDDNAETAGKYGVQSIPTLIVFKDGKPVQRFVGVQSMETLAAAIEAARQ